jgi:hypothetical protein
MLDVLAPTSAKNGSEFMDFITLFHFVSRRRHSSLKTDSENNFLADSRTWGILLYFYL